MYEKETDFCGCRLSLTAAAETACMATTGRILSIC